MPRHPWPIADPAEVSDQTKLRGRRRGQAGGYDLDRGVRVGLGPRVGTGVYVGYGVWVGYGVCVGKGVKVGYKV